MVSGMMVDRVIATKRCLKCANPIVVEAYTIPGAIDQLSGYINCPHRYMSTDGTPLEYRVCGHMEFVPPKFEVKMKQSRTWIQEALKKMK